jgi:hypothetical protein
MLQAVERAVESAEGFLGSLHGLSLIDMLQMFHYAQRSVSLEVLGGLPAAIHLQSGRIVHATYGEAEGEAALAQILALPAGSLSTSPLEAVERTIGRDFQLLMLDLLRRMDERTRGPVPALESAASVEAGLRHLSSDAALGDSSLGSSAAPIDLGLETSAPPGATPVAEAVSSAAVSPASGLLSDACRRTAAELRGDVVCVVVDLERGRVLGSYAASGDALLRGEALAQAALALFRDTPVLEFGGVLEPGADAAPLGGLQRVELTLQGGHFIARATRQRRRVMVLFLGRDTDPRVARSQLDAVFPLVEALAP